MRLKVNIVPKENNSVSEVSVLILRLKRFAGMTSVVAKRYVAKMDSRVAGSKHLAVDGDAKSAITRIANDLGMKEIVLISRVFVWLAQQDDAVIKGVLGLFPKGYESEVAALVLDRMKAKKG